MLQALLLGCSILLLFASTEILYRRFHMAAEHTRKIAHIGGGLLCTAVPHLIPNPAYVFLLIIIFCILLSFSAKTGRMGSIYDVTRGGYGGLLFPLAVGIIYFDFWLSKDALLFYLPLLILTIADPMAYFVGTSYPWKRYSVLNGTKTLSGSMAFFISALVICALVTHAHPQWSLSLTRQAILAFTTTIAEALSTKGYDNITIPIACTLVLLSF